MTTATCGGRGCRPGGWLGGGGSARRDRHEYSIGEHDGAQGLRGHAGRGTGSNTALRLRAFSPRVPSWRGRGSSQSVGARSAPLQIAAADVTLCKAERTERTRYRRGWSGWSTAAGAPLERQAGRQSSARWRKNLRSWRRCQHCSFFSSALRGRAARQARCSRGGNLCQKSCSAVLL